MQLSINEIRNRLEEYSLRVTHQRIVVYKELVQSFEHPTAEIVYNNLKNENPSLSLATVYKTLETFEKCGLIKKIRTSEDSAHYDADINSHNHLLCKRTKRIIDFEDEELLTLVTDYLKTKEIENFKVTEIQLNIIGETLN